MAATAVRRFVAMWMADETEVVREFWGTVADQIGDRGRVVGGGGHTPSRRPLTDREAATSPRLSKMGAPTAAMPGVTVLSLTTNPALRMSSSSAKSAEREMSCRGLR